MKYIFTHNIKRNIRFYIFLTGLLLLSLTGCVSSPRSITMQVLRPAPANLKGGAVSSVAIVLPINALNINEGDVSVPSALTHPDTLLRSFTLSCIEGLRKSPRYSDAVIKTYRGAPLDVLDGFDMVLYVDTILYRISRNVNILATGSTLARVDLYSEARLSVYENRTIADRHSFKDSLQWYGEGVGVELAFSVLPSGADMYWDMGILLASRTIPNYTPVWMPVDRILFMSTPVSQSAYEKLNNGEPVEAIRLWTSTLRIAKKAKLSGDYDPLEFLADKDISNFSQGEAATLSNISVACEYMDLLDKASVISDIATKLKPESSVIRTQAIALKQRYSQLNKIRQQFKTSF